MYCDIPPIDGKFVIEGCAPYHKIIGATRANAPTPSSTLSRADAELGVVELGIKEVRREEQGQEKEVDREKEEVAQEKTTVSAATAAPALTTSTEKADR